METIVIQKPKDITLVEREVPEPGSGEVLIKVMASGICGTDIHIFNGEYLGAYPVIPGHEFSGVVVSTGKPDHALSKREIAWQSSPTSPVTIAFTV